MSDFLFFSLLLWLLAYPATIIALWYFFKRSILFTFGFIWLTCQGILISLGYGVGSLGEITDFLWGFPLGFIFVVLGFIYLNRTVKVNLQLIEKKLNSLSEGDLSNVIEGNVLNKKAEIGNIARAILRLHNSLIKIVNKTKDYSESLSQSSQQLTVSSEQLSKSANEQASSVEEISSTVEEISANIQQNSDNAKEAEIISEWIDKSKGLMEIEMLNLNALENKSVQYS